MLPPAHLEQATPCAPTSATPSPPARPSALWMRNYIHHWPLPALCHLRSVLDSLCSHRDSLQTTWSIPPKLAGDVGATTTASSPTSSSTTWSLCAIQIVWLATIGNAILFKVDIKLSPAEFTLSIELAEPKLCAANLFRHSAAVLFGRNFDFPTSRIYLYYSLQQTKTKRFRIASCYYDTGPTSGSFWGRVSLPIRPPLGRPPKEPLPSVGRIGLPSSMLPHLSVSRTLARPSPAEARLTALLPFPLLSASSHIYASFGQAAAVLPTATPL